MPERIIKVSAKCSDLCNVRLFEDGVYKGEREGYVPKMLNPVDGDEDYVMLHIDIDTGKIVNWKKPTQAELKTFQP